MAITDQILESVIHHYDTIAYEKFHDKLLESEFHKSDNYHHINHHHNNTNNVERKMASDAQKEAIRKALSKPIIQYDKDGTMIKEYRSIAEADRTSGVKKSNIQHVLCGKNKLAGGFIWKYKL